MQSVAESDVITRNPLLVRDILAYQLSEDLTEYLTLFAVMFGPWAFGTTEPWSIWIMRGCGYGLGVLLLLKLMIRRTTGYAPGRWSRLTTACVKQTCYGAGSENQTVPGMQSHDGSQGWLSGPGLARTLGLLTFVILLYCLIAAGNARASFNAATGAFEYYRHVHWLPGTFDSRSSWEAFWSCLALACSFWAVRDWLTGKSPKEMRAGAEERRARGRGVIIPARLRRLLWVLSLSGGVLALEGTVQRLSGSSKLLFVVLPEIHQDAGTQFASFAYRANAAQYLNLLWPVSLGFWWLLRRGNVLPSRRSYLPLVCTGLMAICPILSGARGAALAGLGMLMAALLVLLVSTLSDKHESPRGKAGWLAILFVYFGCIPALGLFLGWHQLAPRLQHFKTDLDERERLYEPARRIARDFPVFGTGPGTFAQVAQFYRGSPEADWPAQLHNDWLETRITFGWVGTAFIGLAFFVMCLSGFVGGASRLGRPFLFLLGLSLLGCVLQARWDFPFQVYSILFQFLIWCAVLLSLAR